MAGRARNALAAAVAFLTVSPLGAASPASAATCAQRVMADWRDGRITGTYSATCLRAAIHSLPEDLRIYGSAEQDITLVLNRELAREQADRPGTRALMGRGPTNGVDAAQATRIAAADSGWFPVRIAIVIGAALLTAAAVAASIWRSGGRR
jgi:hypothetical protein